VWRVLAKASAMNHRLTCTWLGLIVSSLGLGCQAPSYQLPGGFSSTYYRRLHDEIPPNPVPVELPLSETIPNSPGVFYPQTFQYNPPTKSEFQQAVLLPENRPQGPRRY
jgi:hypothetical protein